MDKAEYLEKLQHLQKELALVQQAYLREGRRALVVFEGGDAAGKGGVIRRLAWALDPRSLRVHSIAAPSVSEQQQHWLKRFWTRIPDKGEWVIFDRSWYGRVLVERVEGFASKDEWERAYDEIVAFEKTLADEDIRIVKLYLNVSEDEQLERFRARYKDPAKQWKLTEEDIRNRARRGDYDAAVNDMRSKTSWDGAPWKVLDADSKKETRLACFRHIIDQLGRDVPLAPPPPSDMIRAFFEDPD